MRKFLVTSVILASFSGTVLGGCLESYEHAVDLNSNQSWFNQQYQYRGHENPIINAGYVVQDYIGHKIAERNLNKMIDARIKNASLQEALIDIIQGNETDKAVGLIYSKLRFQTKLSKGKVRDSLIELSKDSENFCISIEKAEEVQSWVTEKVSDETETELHLRGKNAGLITNGDYLDMARGPIQNHAIRVLTVKELVERIEISSQK